MKKLYLLLIAALLSSCNHEGKKEVKNKLLSKNATELMFPYSDTLNWKQIEKQNDVLKDQFIKSNLKEFKNEYSGYEGEDSLKNLKTDLHIYDINNDGKDDLIFDGRSGGEAEEVALILNTGNGFKVVFKDFQHLVKLKIENNKIAELYIKDDGCCDAWIDFNKIYQVDYRASTPKFNMIFLTANVHNGYFPKKYLDKPIKFQVLNNNYKLRSSPRIDDTTSGGYGGEPYKGNTIGVLSKDSKGRAIAEETDNTGRLWFLAELNAESNISNGVFYEPEKTERISAKIGWVSSRFVKKLN